MILESTYYVLIIHFNYVHSTKMYVKFPLLNLTDTSCRHES